MWLRQLRVWGLSASLITMAFALVNLASGPQVPTGFQANETVESIRLELAIGDGGEGLDEPIALDLGLGFPFWLQNVGQVESYVVPFGAVSQTGTQQPAIPAGNKATFEFSLNSSAGLDSLGSVPQLLAGIRVSDIRRIAFTSKADHGWILASYKLFINGRLFFKNDSVNINGRGSQDQARERLMELNREPSAERSEWIDLKALEATHLATDADRARLRELDASLETLLTETQLLERQLQGAAPFYSDSGFQPAASSNGTIQKVKVIVVTAPHTAASTRNYVYFATGGHKYLLGSAIQPLGPEFGPQEFVLDLRTAPLTASDLRGYALGVLAPHIPMNATPDRWHPQRLRVEIDDRVVYDSEDNRLDQASLSAIRLIPPAHLDAAGAVVNNVPIAREAYVWQAGSGAGLDLVNGGADPLPALQDPTYPTSEPSVVIDQDIHQTIDLVQQEQESWYDPLAEPFPGEMSFGPDWQPGGWSSSGWLPDWGSGWNNGWGPGYDPGPGWLNLFLFGLANLTDNLPDGVLPDPVGTPPQLEHVRVDYGTQSIHWTVVGDASQIDHFVVDRILIRPDADIPIVEILGAPFSVPAGQRSLPWSELEPLMPAWTADEASRNYMAYRVTMVPSDPTLGVDPGLAAAAPARAMNPLANFHLSDDIEYVPMGGLPQHLPLIAAGEPELPGPTAWRGGEMLMHNGIDIAGLAPLQHHIVARAQTNGDRTTIEAFGILPPGHHRFIAFGGFVGAVDQHVAAQIDSVVHVQSVADPTLQIGFPAGVVNLEADPALPPSALQPVIHDIDTSMVGPGLMSFRASYTFHHSVIDPQHPPALVGLRLLGM